jgi:hypothetical protein
MSKDPIPHGEHYDPCTLRRRYRVSLIGHGADKQNALKVVPPIRGRKTRSSKKAHVRASMASGNNPPKPYPNPELKHP